MRKFLVLSVLLVAMLASVQAFAAEKRIVFINSADVEIKGIFLAPTGTKQYGQNLLKKYKLKPGTKTNIAVPHDRGNCMWDLRYTIKDVDICKAVEIELFLKNDQAWANIK